MTTTTTPTETTVTTNNQGIPEQNSVTNPAGAIISDNTYKTLVNYAISNGVTKCDIVWTGHKEIDNSIIVLGNATSDTILAAGAFQITSGAKFYEMTKDYFAADEYYEDDDIYYFSNSNYVIWRVCDEDYLNKYPDNELAYFEFEGQEKDIRFTVWPELEQFPEWALIPK